jgi:ubiquitin-protein ligase
MKEYQTEQQEQSQSSSGRKQQAARDENILSLAPKDAELQDLLEWTATVKGPLGGYYEGE